MSIFAVTPAVCTIPCCFGTLLEICSGCLMQYALYFCGFNPLHVPWRYHIRANISSRLYANNNGRFYIHDPGTLNSYFLDLLPSRLSFS